MAASTTLDTTRNMLSTGFNALATGLNYTLAKPTRFIFSSISNHYAAKNETKDRIAVSAFMNAASTDQADLEKWVRRNMASDTLDNFNAGNKVKLSADDITKHLGNMKRKDKKILTEARENHIRVEAEKFFDEHGKVEKKEAPQNREKHGVSAKNFLAEGIGRASDTFRQSSFATNEIKTEQSERLLSMAFRDVKARTPDSAQNEAIKTWLKQSKEKGTLKLFIPEGEKLKASIGDVMKHLDNISPEHRKELLQAGKEYRSEDNVIARADKTYAHIRGGPDLDMG